MPKLKTHKATAKRIRFTGKKKMMKRKAGQDHFNARDRGTTTMGKRRDMGAHETLERAINKLVPYQ
jgi:ribosomal protein L35